MKEYFLAFLIGLFLTACSDKPSEKELKSLFDRSTYDTNVIQNLYLYDSIKNIVIKNIDTIFKFRNERHIVTHVDENGKETHVQENSDFYTFDKDYGHPTSLSYGTGSNNQKLIDEVSLENMPKLIFPSINTLFIKLKEKNIKGFNLNSDSSIEISIKNLYDEKINADVYHTLNWKTRFADVNEPDLMIKNKVLAPGWTYEILVEAHRGW